MDTEPDRLEARIGVRPAVEADLAVLNDLYNRYIRETHITFDLEPISMDARREWFGRYRADGPHRLLVASIDDEVVGYASSSQHRVKGAYETSVETSVYLVPAATGRGIGTLLYGELFNALEGEDLHRALAGITLPNRASIALHEKFGFVPVGVFTEQGRKFGRYWDVAWYEKPLEPRTT